MKRLTQKQRRLTAAHEAGHAVLALIQGVKFDSVWVEEFHGERSGAIRYLDGTKDTLGNTGIRLMGGLAAEKITLGRSCRRLSEKDYRDIACTDVDQLARYAVGDLEGIQREPIRWKDGEMVVNPFMGRGNEARAVPAFVNDCLRKAYMLLTEHADIHRRLTDALVERGTLSYDECRALVSVSEDHRECTL